MESKVRAKSIARVEKNIESNINQQRRYLKLRRGIESEIKI